MLIIYEQESVDRCVDDKWQMEYGMVMRRFTQKRLSENRFAQKQVVLNRAGRAIASCLMALACVGLSERPGLAQWVEPYPNGSYESDGETYQPESAIADSQHACTAQLQGSIDDIIDRPTFETAEWGVVIEDMDDDRPLYQHNENHYFIPASNIKLLTTAAALQSLRFDNDSDLFAFHRWIHVTNRNSNNSYADSLLRRLGGPQSVDRALATLNIDPNSYRQVDGSGLSRYNMAKPTTFISVLKAMMTVPENNIFYGSLPVAGHSGTLRNRFRGTSAQGNVHAKTGTLRGVRALSGYLEHPRQGTLVFSILVNQPHQSGSTMLRAIDDIVLEVMDIDRC